MLKQHMDVDTLGAEALPGGLAEIIRVLQPALKAALPAVQVRKAGGIRGFFAWRKKRQDSAA